jgi:hypothetical protein
MSPLLDRLMRQLEARGLSILPGKEPGQLLLAGPDAEKTPEVVAAVKAFKPQLLALVGAGVAQTPPPTPVVAEPEPDPPGEPDPRPETCKVCGSLVCIGAGVTAEDVARFCPVTGNREVPARNGPPGFPARPPCPYRTRGGG